MKRIMSLVLKRYAIHYVAVFLCIIIGAFANIQGTLFTQKLIDDYIKPLSVASNPDFGPLAAALGKVAIIYLIGALCSWTFNRIMIYVGQGALLDIRKRIFHHMESLPIRYFDTHSHGDIMSIYTNDTDTLRQMISQSIPQVVNSFVTIISVFISMLILNIPMTIVSVVMVVILTSLTKKLITLSGKFFHAQQMDTGALNGYIEEMMEGQKVVKVFCHEEESIEKFHELNNQLRVSANNANKYANILPPVTFQMGNVSYVVCALVGAVLAVNGYMGLTIGILVSFLTLNKNFNGPIGHVSQQIQSIVMASAGAKRICDLLDEVPETDEGYVTLVNAKRENGQLMECEERTGIWAWKHPHKDGTITFEELKGDVVFDDVDFGYTDEKMVLHNITLYATPGQKIAFVGSTGAGKTTITNLINRFYDIQDGKIRYDGININKIKKADLRKSLGIVLQDTHLFTGTVLDNIRYGRLDATDEECIRAAKLANADSFIEVLPEGYQTVLKGDGSNLSQGQRQLLSIARAAVADSTVLILDEATSSIDTRTERLVQQGMDSLMEGRTTFVIAHRLSTVKNSDCIMVLEHGRIIERGNHQELIDAKGKYYQLYTGKAMERE